MSVCSLKLLLPLLLLPRISGSSVSIRLESPTRGKLRDQDDFPPPTPNLAKLSAFPDQAQRGDSLVRKPGSLHLSEKSMNTSNISDFCCGTPPHLDCGMSSWSRRHIQSAPLTFFERAGAVPVDSWVVREILSSKELLCSGWDGGSRSP